MPGITSRLTRACASLVRGACQAGGTPRDPHERTPGGPNQLSAAPRPGNGAPGAHGRAGARPGGPMARKWILVVDDDHAVRRYLTVVLENAGYAVVCAHGGSEARDLIRSLRPHLVILDLRMPQMSGGELLQTIEEIPVLVLSGYLGDLSPEDAARQNVVGRLQKPVDPATLRRYVQAALRDVTP